VWESLVVILGLSQFFFGEIFIGSHSLSLYGHLIGPSATSVHPPWRHPLPRLHLIPPPPLGRLDGSRDSRWFGWMVVGWDNRSDGGSPMVGWCVKVVHGGRHRWQAIVARQICRVDEDEEAIGSEFLRFL
jgi:hypothetical protein